MKLLKTIYVLLLLLIPFVPFELVMREMQLHGITINSPSFDLVLSIGAAQYWFGVVLAVLLWPLAIWLLVDVFRSKKSV
jgi:hypothetical protein